MIAELLRYVLAAIAFLVPGDALAIRNAISTRHAWVGPAKPCLPQILLAVVTGAMLTLNVPFTKHAKTTTVCDAKRVNA